MSIQDESACAARRAFAEGHIPKQLLSGRYGFMCPTTNLLPTEADPMTGKREAHRCGDCHPVAAKGAIRLSPAARPLWGKSDHGMNHAWLPLFVHMIDSSQVAGRLWDEWAAKFIKKDALVSEDARVEARGPVHRDRRRHHVGEMRRGARAVRASRQAGWRFRTAACTSSVLVDRTEKVET